jgi:hypothetical protein
MTLPANSPAATGISHRPPPDNLAACRPPQESLPAAFPCGPHRPSLSHQPQAKLVSPANPKSAAGPSCRLSPMRSLPC